MKKKKLLFGLLLMFVFGSLSSRLNAQDVLYDFSLFTIVLPDNLYDISTEETDCYTLCTEGRESINCICFFDIDEEFELVDRLRDEAKEFNIDIDETGYLALTTGTSSPLLWIMAEFDEFSLVMGVYPDYENETGIFVCLIDRNKDMTNLITRLSSFRLKDIE